MVPRRNVSTEGDEESQQLRRRNRASLARLNDHAVYNVMTLVAGISTLIIPLALHPEQEVNTPLEALKLSGLSAGAIAALNLIGSIPLQREAPSGPQASLMVQQAEDVEESAITCLFSVPKCVKETACAVLPPVLGWGIALGIGETLQDLGFFADSPHKHENIAVIAAGTANIIHGLRTFCCSAHPQD